MSHDLSICKICGRPFDAINGVYFRTEYGHEVCYYCDQEIYVDKKQLGEYIKHDYKLYIDTKNKYGWLDKCGIDFDDSDVVESINNMSDYDLGTKYLKLCTEFKYNPSTDYDDQLENFVPDEIIKWPEDDVERFIVMYNIDNSLSVNENIVRNIDVFEKFLPKLTKSDNRINSFKLEVDKLSCMYTNLYVTTYPFIVFRIRFTNKSVSIEYINMPTSCNNGILL